MKEDFTCEEESEEGKRRRWSIGGRAGEAVEGVAGSGGGAEGPGGGKEGSFNREIIV